MIILGLLAGIFLAHNVEKTVLYQNCGRGDLNACAVLKIKPSDVKPPVQYKN